MFKQICLVLSISSILCLARPALEQSRRLLEPEPIYYGENEFIPISRDDFNGIVADMPFGDFVEALSGVYQFDSCEEWMNERAESDFDGSLELLSEAVGEPDQQLLTLEFIRNCAFDNDPSALQALVSLV